MQNKHRVKKSKWIFKMDKMNRKINRWLRRENEDWTKKMKNYVETSSKSEKNAQWKTIMNRNKLFRKGKSDTLLRSKQIVY